MLARVRWTRFRKDVKRMQKRGKAMKQLAAARQDALPAECRDHALRGDWAGFRDLHIEPDWLLLYRVAGDEVQLARTGMHSGLFRK